MDSRQLLMRAGTLALTLLLVACSANHKSIYRHEVVAGKASITLTDAKQRAILSNLPPSEAAKSSEQYQRFCAEPSPDVFAVIAQSLSVGGSFGQQADPKAIELAINAAFASSEQGSTIPRTQTISMLRELMYRTCERYLNGGISSLELQLQAIRDQRLMVSIIAIEQLTGAVASRSVTLGAIAQANAGASIAGVVAELGKAREDVQAKEKALDAALAARKGLTVTIDGKKVEACGEIDKATTDEAKGALHADIKAKSDECNARRDEQQKKESQFKDAKVHYESLDKFVREGGLSVGSKAEVLAAVPGAALERVDGTSSVQGVAEIVNSIVHANFAQDEFLFLCLKTLPVEQKDKELLVDLRASCLEYIKSTVNAQKARADALGASVDAERSKAELLNSERQLQRKRIDAEVSRLQSESNRQFEIFWRAISDEVGTAVDPGKLQQVKDRSAKAVRWPTCFAVTSTKASAQGCFLGLVESQRQALIQSIQR